MIFFNKKIPFIFIILFLLCVCIACTDMIHSRKLPITIRVLDNATRLPVAGAMVELQWRTGFQGFYWGKPVRKISADNGDVIFQPSDVPPVSEDGYSLGSKIQKLFISTIIVSAEGYRTTIWAYPENDHVFETLIIKGKQEEIYRMPESP